jgi:ssDNA-binding Zn-finger/Zn-ribbon topoisomerase 1
MSFPYSLETETPMQELYNRLPEKSSTKSTEQSCPECEQGIMLRQTINNGKNKGKPFFGCNRYPECRHTEV